MTDKTDAEFIAECENIYRGAHMDGVPDKVFWHLREAVERLKAANKLNGWFVNLPTYNRVVEENAELRELLRWAREQMRTCGRCEGPCGSSFWGKVAEESPSKRRIEDILHEAQTKPS